MLVEASPHRTPRAGELPEGGAFNKCHDWVRRAAIGCSRDANGMHQALSHRIKTDILLRFPGALRTLAGP